ncbi:FUSC family protein [Mycobacterium sp. NPDC003449]
MTGPEDSQSGTRPISVAELLAKNGTIGAPPVGGRRRRRRGNSDAVTVAELTGEIPVVDDEPDDEPAPQTGRAADPRRADTDVVPVQKPAPEPRPVDAEPRTGNGSGPAPKLDAKPESRVRPEPAGRPPARPEPARPEPEPARGAAAAEFDDEYEADYEAHLRAREADPEPVEFRPRQRRRRPHYSGPRDYTPTGTGAERMSPDWLDDPDEADRPGAKAPSGPGTRVDPDEDYDDSRDEGDTGDRPSYFGSSLGPLFGGQSVADDLARRRGGADGLDRVDDLDDDLDDDRQAAGLVGESDDVDDFDATGDTAASEGGSPLMRGMWIVGQCIVAVAFGAGLFIAFDQLWKWNTIVALILGVLVILGLAGGVRVVRKTEDIGSTLTAVAVGALVTFGPLALLQAS